MKSLLGIGTAALLCALATSAPAQETPAAKALRAMVKKAEYAVIKDGQENGVSYISYHVPSGAATCRMVAIVFKSDYFNRDMVLFQALSSVDFSESEETIAQRFVTHLIMMNTGYQIGYWAFDTKDNSLWFNHQMLAEQLKGMKQKDFERLCQYMTGVVTATDSQWSELDKAEQLSAEEPLGMTGGEAPALRLLKEIHKDYLRK